MALNVERVRVEGTAQTAANGVATRKVAIPNLPIDGTFSVSGTILAVDTTGARSTTHQVQFNLNCSGVCVAGVATETDGIAGGSAWPTQPTVNPLTGTLVTVVFNAGSPTANPSMELEFTGATIGGGVPVDWYFELDATLGTI